MTLGWVRSIADPADDLRAPMKGPLRAVRDGSAELHRAAIALTKAARLLPAALVLQVDDAAGFAAQHNLTLLPVDAALDTGLSTLNPIISARLPLEVSEAGRLHIFRHDDGAEEHYAI